MPTKQLLEAVTVTGKSADVYTKIDRQVYKSNQFQTAQGGSAIDVLKNMPSVSVNSQGEILVRGSSGFQVLINGKPVQGGVADILAQLPANTIENIELITSPSAKYDADGKAGIINISTKKGTDDGLSILLNGQAGLPSLNDFGNKETPKRYNGDITLNYKKNKWDVLLGGNYQRNDIAGRREGDVYTIVNNISTKFPSVGERSFQRYNGSVRTAIIFTPNKSNAFSASFFEGTKTQYRRADITYNNTKIDTNTKQVLENFSYFNSNLVKRWANFTMGNVDYNHVFANKSTLSASVLFENDRFEGFTKNNNLHLPAKQDTIQYTLNTGVSTLDAYRIKIDYSINIGVGKLEAGYQYRHQQQDGNYLYQQAIIGTTNYITYPEFSDVIGITNITHAMYTQYSAVANSLSYSGGFRYEYATRSFKAGQQPNSVDLNLSNLFPSANLQYAFSNHTKLKAAYSRRVQRATNSELNPLPEREHSETLEQGDPTILPEFIDLTELGITQSFAKGSFFATLYHQGIENIVNRVNKVFADTILYRIYTNAGKANLWGLEAALTLNTTKWWQWYIGANIYRFGIKGGLFNQQVAVDNQGVVYSFNTNSNFQLSHTASVQLNFNYISEKVTSQGKDLRFFIPNLSFKKTFLNDKLAASFLWQNIALGDLKTNQQRITTSGTNFYTTTNYIQEVNIIQVGFSYKLNQLSKKAKLPVTEFGEKEF